MDQEFDRISKRCETRRRINRIAKYERFFDAWFKGCIFGPMLFVLGLNAISLAYPFHQCGGGKSHHRACFHNQKIILGAVEMYNLDTGENFNIRTRDDLVHLANLRYLQSVPTDPGCKRAKHNYRSDLAGNVWCMYHGNIEGEDGVIRTPFTGAVQTKKGVCAKDY